MPTKVKKRVGRGGKRGTYSGRGMKGQKSRAGRKMVPVIRGSIKRYPKLRGYRFNSFKNISVLNISDLEKNFKEGEDINPNVLVSKKIVKRGKVKILGNGNITKKFNVENCLLSASAKEKILKGGGTIKD